MKERHLCRTNDEKAIVTIIIRVTPMQIAHIKNYESSKEACKVSLTFFKQPSSMKMNEGDCMQTFPALK